MKGERINDLKYSVAAFVGNEDAVLHDAATFSVQVSSRLRAFVAIRVEEIVPGDPWPAPFAAPKEEP